MKDPASKPDTTEVAVPSADAEPPDPPGYVAPLVYGRDPPRAGQFDRSSVWTVHDPGGAIRHTVGCDTMELPELVELLRVLFAGASPSGAVPVLASNAVPVLEIEWREHGKIIAVSTLYSDGTLVRDKDGARTVDRKLEPDALAAVAAEIDRAGLRDASRTWCGPKPP